MSSTNTPSSSSESTRNRRQSKPPETFSHEIYVSTPRIRKQQVPQRTRNESSGSSNKWDQYRAAMKKAASILSRELHFEDVYKTQSKDTRGDYSGNFSELDKCQQRIFDAKKSIIGVFKSVEAENKDHKRWPQLEAEDGDDDMVNIDEIYCSKCGSEDEEGNDILFCDKKGCCRAYHQKCLDPPLSNVDDIAKDDVDWFCWQCECMDDCISNVNYVLDKDYTDWRLFFPDISDEVCEYVPVSTKKRVKKESESSESKVTKQPKARDSRTLKDPSGFSDIGRPVAKVVNGYVAIGTITSFKILQDSTILASKSDEKGSGDLDGAMEIVKSDQKVSSQSEQSAPVHVLTTTVEDKTSEAADVTGKLDLGVWTVKFENGVTQMLGVEELKMALQMFLDFDRSGQKMKDSDYDDEEDAAEEMEEDDDESSVSALSNPSDREVEEEDESDFSDEEPKRRASRGRPRGRPAGSKSVTSTPSKATPSKKANPVSAKKRPADIATPGSEKRKRGRPRKSVEPDLASSLDVEEDKESENKSASVETEENSSSKNDSKSNNDEEDRAEDNQDADTSVSV